MTTTMPSASLRLGFLLAMVLASMQAAGEPRFWALTGVKFSDGAVATGYLSYDDATRTVVDWNVRVESSPELDPFSPLIAFTYVPGNSTASVWPAAVTSLHFYSERGGMPSGDPRVLGVTAVARLDGKQTTVPLYPEGSSETFDSWPCCWSSRSVSAGSLVLMSQPPPTTIVQVDEFYHRQLRHYFIVAGESEKQDLDNGVHPGWVRTGESFKAYATGSVATGSANPVCRYYGRPSVRLDSHFYSADAAECLTVHQKYGAHWSYESDNVFQIHLPDLATGSCPEGTVPVYRLWNQRSDSNHRYTTSAGIKSEMIASGYVPEGYGPDGVAMCGLK